MEKIVNKLINDAIEGVDTYFHNGSIWLIFTEKKQWVIELGKDGELWYNYYFFKNLFNYVSLDVIENQHYITKWVEDILQNGVKSTLHEKFANNFIVEDTIRNGIKYAPHASRLPSVLVEDAIQNGIKHTELVTICDHLTN